MLEFLRTKMKGILWVTVIAFIGTIFVSWGMGGAARRVVSRVATVNGEDISPQEHYKMVRRLESNIRDLLGENYTDELLAQFNIENQAIEGLIMQKLMQQKAREFGLIVTDGEVLAKIRTYPQFQTDGHFDPAKYNAVIANPRNANILPSIEANERSQLLVDKLDFLIKGSVTVTEKEIRDQFHLENDQYQITFVRINPIDFVTKEKVNQYYKDHMDEFKNPLTIKASHILFKVEDTEEETLIEARKVREEILSGADFGEMAVKHSDGPTASVKGDLGFFPRGRMVPEFDAVAFNLEVGEVSEPVKTDFGYHLIKVTEKKTDQLPKLDDIYDQVALKVANDEEFTIADELLAKTKNKVTEVGTLQKAAKTYNLLASESNQFKWKDEIAEDLPWNEELWLTAASLEVNQVSEPISVGQKKYLLQLKQHLIGEEKEYQKQRQSIKDKITSSKRESVFQNWYQDLRTKAKVEILLEDYQKAVKAYSG